MKFINNKKNYIFDIYAEYVDYRNSILLNIKLFFINIRFILKNCSKMKTYKSKFIYSQNNMLSISSSYNVEVEKLYVKFRILFLINIVFALIPEDLLVNGYYKYLKNIYSGKSFCYKHYTNYNIKPKDIKLIAYYLTQFHPIPENDKWWGKGFTEWANVVKALPQFKGHYQPRLPGDLGYYDLRLKEVHEEQVRIAKNYGIYGFCYYFYWFNGKRLLEQPLDLVLNNPDLDFPFCLFWANESWARRWDGSEEDILIEQKYSDEDDLNLIKFLFPIFKDRRYIRVNNKPLLNIYRPTLMPNMKKTIKMWRKYCIDNGGFDLYITISNTHSVENPEKFGADASIEYAIGRANNYDINKLELFNNNYTSGAWIVDYNDIIDYSYNKAIPNYKEFRSLCPDWDNEARRAEGKGGTIINSTPYLYKFWLEHLINNTKENFEGDERLVFINAWNEWAEGTYLEPDSRNGYAYLDATARALIDSNSIIGDNEVICKYNKIIPFSYEKIFEYNNISNNDIILNTLSKKCKNAIIVFDHNLGEGADIYLDEKIKENIQNNIITFVIYTNNDKYFMEVNYKYDKYYYYFYDLKEISFIYDLFLIEEIFVNNLASYKKYLYQVINYVINISEEKKINVILPVHDYFYICPRCFLLYKNKYYCNIPSDLKICKKCIKGLYFKNIKKFREIFQNLFDISSEVLFFSNSSKDIFSKVYFINEEKIKIIPHKVNWINRIPINSIKKDKLHIGILGKITKIKGYSILEDLLNLSSKNNNMHFYLIGDILNSDIISYSNITIHGKYKHENLVEIVEKYDIDIFIMPSICPETFSYTTQEIILMEKPIICFNLGAQAERVSKYDKGYIAEDISAEAMYECIMEFYNSKIGNN